MAAHRFGRLVGATARLLTDFVIKKGDTIESRNTLAIESPWDREPAAVSSRASSRVPPSRFRHLPPGSKSTK
jgi:hypothetical protein